MTRHFSFRSFAALAALAVVSVPAQAQSQGGEKPVFLVTEVVVGDDVVGVDKEAARDALVLRFGRLKEKIEVRSLSEAKASLDAAALQQLLGSEEQADLDKIQGYVQVDRIVFGRISTIAGITEVQVRVYNVTEGVAEVGFARRLKASSPPSMVLTMLDTLADSLLAWTINTYTDGEMSAKASALANKKLGGKKPAAADVVEAPSSSRFSWLGTVGGIGFGAGAAAAGVGAYQALSDNDASTADIALIGAGAAVGLIGAIAVGVDIVTE
jgi:hypothetical protein